MSTGFDQSVLGTTGFLFPLSLCLSLSLTHTHTHTKKVADPWKRSASLTKARDYEANGCSDGRSRKTLQTLRVSWQLAYGSREEE